MRVLTSEVDQVWGWQEVVDGGGRGTKFYVEELDTCSGRGGQGKDKILVSNGATLSVREVHNAYYVVGGMIALPQALGSPYVNAAWTMNGCRT